MILYLVIALITLFVGYVGIVTWKYGVLHSISRSFYTLRQVNKGGWFRFLMFTSGLLLILIAAYSGVVFAWLLYASGIGAILTGAAAMYYKEITGKVHYIASGTMLLGAISFVSFVFSPVIWVLTVLGLFIVIYFRNTMPNPVYWYELYAFSSVLSSLLWWSISL